MCVLKGYCAGVLVFKDENVSEGDLPSFLDSLKTRVRKGEIPLTFAYETQVVSEMCLDVYEAEDGDYRPDLSTAIK